ncbi:hypothetical protein LSCM1_02908 [Leishmania martiniquensis]|uniref:Uncharacterized protein n=1 Tax=Leishmania martiniquensis TaxID=1580590 RepID=A0A836GU18_9TRYP|nr:hypothetical protein LSCM1_02908 [Leishmania martiniquensis]
MLLVGSTAPTNSVGSGGGAHLIHAVCAADGYTLVFAIASAAGTGSARHSSFDVALFSFGKTAHGSSEADPRGPRPSSSVATPQRAIRAALYACSLGGSRGSDLALSAHDGCEGCSACRRAAASAGDAGAASTLATARSHASNFCLPVEHSAAAAASVSDTQSSSTAALRASQLMYSLLRGEAAAKASPAGRAAGAPATSSQRSPTRFSGDHLVALHLVRQEAWQCSPGAAHAATLVAMTHDASSATVLLAEVLCCFDCGCAALATYKLTRHSPPAEWSVQLSGCVWIPSTPSPTSAPRPGTDAVGGWTCQQTWATGAPLVSSLVRTLPLTARSEASADAIGDGSKSLLELLVVWCSPTVASSFPTLPSSSCAHPVARYASLRGCGGCLQKASVAAGEWRLHAQAIFDISELLRLAWPPSPSSRDFRSSASSFGILPYASVRSLQWLPGTADFKQSYPLLAVLYAAPITPSRRTFVASGGPIEPCLDSLAVCYLKEEGDQLSAATDPAAATPHRTPTIVAGRLLEGPWSVRGLSLAHPHFLFATALASLRSPSQTAPSTTNKRSATAPTASAPSAGRRFRAAIHSSTDAAAVLLGVFQRPAQQPYATSSLYRSIAAAVDGREHGGGTAADAPLVRDGAARTGERAPLQRATRAQGDLNMARSSSVFAFVLYGPNGEEARCKLDGYVDDAQTAFLEPRIMTARRGDGSRTSVDLTRCGSQGERRTVARVCALLFEKPLAPPEARAHCCSAVVITIQAQWTRAMPMVTDGRRSDSVCRNSGMTADEHWSFSVHVLHALRSSAASFESLPRPLRNAPLQMFARILCWRSTAANPEVTASDISCLVCGYATTPHADDTIGHEANTPYHTVLEGVFELRLCSSDVNGTDVLGGRAAAVAGATSTALGVAAKEGRPSSSATAPLSEPSTAFAGPCPWALGSCTRVVLPSAFSGLLHSLSAADTLTTPFDLLSHTPTLSVAAGRLGASVNDGVVPVAVAWLAGDLYEGEVDGLAGRDPCPATTAASFKSSLPSHVREMDAVALLRSGDVVGWRCVSRSRDAASATGGLPSGEGAVVHLGALCWGYEDNAAVPLKRLFLESLLNCGAGADAVHLKVIMTPNEGALKWPGHQQPPAGLPTKAVAETAATGTVLLVLAVGSLVGVVDLSTGAVMTVRDLRTDVPDLPEREDGKERVPAAVPATAGGVTPAATWVLRLQRLPVVSPCGWIAFGDTTRGAGAAVGASWCFLWCGAREVQHGPSSLAFALRLSVLHWADVVSAHVGAASSSAAGSTALVASTLDTEPSPLPLVAIQVDACWLGETDPPAESTSVSSLCALPPLSISAGGADSFAAACVGWLPCTMAGVDAGVSPAAPRGVAAGEETEGALAGAAGCFPLLNVSDGALLRALWPVMATSHGTHMPMKQSGSRSSPLSMTAVPRHRLPLRFLRWGSLVPRPSLPSFLLLRHEFGACCAMEQLTGGATEAALGVPLNAVYRSLLSDSCDASAAFVSPETGRDVDSLCRRTCRKVLYVSPLSLRVCADELRADEHESVSQNRTVTGSLLLGAPSTEPARPSPGSSSWHVLLCTMLLCKDEPTPVEGGSTRSFPGAPASCGVGCAAAATCADWRHAQAVSYLLCSVPAHASVMPPLQPPCSAAAGRLFPLSTWHWIPLYVSTPLPAPGGHCVGGPAPAGTAMTGGAGGVEEHHVPLAITRALPLPSATLSSLAVMPPSTSASAEMRKNVGNAMMAPSQFYCEGTRTGSAAAAAPHPQRECYCLSVQGHRLRRLLERSAVAASTEDYEQVFVYAAVDPDLVRVAGASPTSCARVLC